MGRGRRCIECDEPLYPHEQGALCSRCFYEAICQPGPDTGGEAPEPDQAPGYRGSEPTSLQRRRERRGF